MPSNSTPSNRKHTAHLAVVRQQTKIITYAAIAIVVLVISLIGYALIVRTPFAMQFQNVATVNGEGISANDFQMRVKVARINLLNQFSEYYQYYQFFQSDPNFAQSIASQLEALQSQLDPQNAAILGEQVLDQMIDERIILQEAAKRGLTVSDEEIEIGLQEAFGFFANGTPTPAPTATESNFVAEPYPTLGATQLAMVTLTPTSAPTDIPTATATLEVEPTATATLVPPTATAEPEFTSTPEPTATPYTLEGYQTAVAQTMQQFSENTGMTEAQYREFMRYQILSQKVFDAITADVDNTYAEVWARHILVATEEEANVLLVRLEAGEDWVALAAEFSLDGSAQTGGDLGWFGPGRMVPEFEAAAFALENPGDISPVVKSDYGFHIIQLVDRHERPASPEEVDALKQSAYNEWLAAARTEAKIEKNDSFWREIVPTEPTLQ